MPFLGNTPAESYISFAKQDITGNGGTSYSLNHPVTNAADIELFVNNVQQEPTEAYTASGSTLTLSEAIASTDDCYCIFRGRSLQTVSPPDGSVTSAKLDTNISIAGTFRSDGHAAVGANIVASTRALSVAGATDGGGSEIINCFNSSLASKFSVRDDGLTTVAGTLVASGGVAIGGTGTANTLDDYEEGTWTPIIKYGAGSSFTTITSPNSASAAYRKIGNLLYISFYFYKNSSAIGGSGGTWRVQGFPFALVSGSTSGYQSVPVGYWSINGTNYFNSIPTRWQANGSDFLDMYGAQASTAWSSGNYEVAGHGVLMTA